MKRILGCLFASAADFCYAAACAWFAYAWFQYDETAIAVLMELRNWMAYELLAYLILMALALLVAPDITPEVRRQRSIGEWTFLVGFLLFTLLLSASLSWLGDGNAVLFVYLLGFLVVRSASHLMEGGFHAFDGLLDLAAYLRLAIIPMFLIGMVQVEWLEWYGMNRDLRLIELAPREAGAIQLALLGFWFYLGYGIFHIMRSLQPDFVLRTWPGSKHFFQAEY